MICSLNLTKKGSGQEVATASLIEKTANHGAHLLELRNCARALQLSYADSLRLAAVDYGNRLRFQHPRRIRLKSGAFVVVRHWADILILREVFTGVYELPLSRATRILDLGANIGISAIYFNQRFPDATIACVEASPQNQPFLAENIQANRISARVFRAAISDTGGNLVLAWDGDGSCQVPSSQYTSLVDVPAMTVPDVLREMKWDRLDLLKIDIEGGERRVLHVNNDWLSLVSVIAGEIHECYSPENLRNDLEPFGFKLQISNPTKYGQATFIGAKPASDSRP